MAGGLDFRRGRMVGHGSAGGAGNARGQQMQARSPKTDDSQFNITVEAPPGSNLAYTRIKAEEAAALPRSEPEVAYTYTTIGGQSGAVDQATIYVRLTPKAERARSQQDVETREVTVRLAPGAREQISDLATLPLVIPAPEGPVTPSRWGRWRALSGTSAPHRSTTWTAIA